MSDSEEDTNFESADEGDGEDDNKKKDEKKKVNKNVEDKSALVNTSNELQEQCDTKSNTSDKDEKKKVNNNAEDKSALIDTSDELHEQYDTKSNNDNDIILENSLPTINSLKTSAEETETVVNTKNASELQLKDLDSELNLNIPVKAMTISSNDRGHDPLVTDQPQVNKFDENVNNIDDNKLQSLFDNMSSANDNKKSSGWGGWGGWGSSLLSTAANSVSTFTSQVGEGLNTVLETVESSLGVPDPEEVAKLDSEENAQNIDSNEATESNDEWKIEDTDDGDSEGWLSWGATNAIGGFTNLTNVVEKTGKTLVTGSLDVLETIGKKTYDAIGEGDHGLKQVIKKTKEKPNLSQLLKDAKEQYEQNCKENEKLDEERKVHFGSMFDEYNGLLHLEALEILSSQCELRVDKILEMMPKDDVGLIKPHLLTLRNVFDISESEDENENYIDEHNFIASIKKFNADIALPLTSDKLTHMQEKINHWLTDADEEQESGAKISSKEIHQTAIQMLAEFTATGVQHYHKIAQLLPLNPIETPDAYIEKADALVSITKVMRDECEILATRFTKCLTHSSEQLDNPNDINPLMTSVYLESGNSKVYLEDALKLLLPILQEKLLMSHAEL